MSISALLIPLGIATFTAISTAIESLQQQSRVEETAIRVSDPHLIARSLEALGATNVQVSADAVRANTAVGQIVFTPVAQVFAGIVRGATPEVSQHWVKQVEDRAGHIAQQRTAALAKSQAEQLGFRLIEEETAEGTINYVFEEI